MNQVHELQYHEVVESLSGYGGSMVRQFGWFLEGNHGLWGFHIEFATVPIIHRHPIQGHHQQDSGHWEKLLRLLRLLHRGGGIHEG